MSEQILVNGEPIAYELCPVSYMVDGLRLYFERGIPPGSFMQAVLRNDLMDACGRADINNQQAIFEWARWLHNYAPAGSFGSPEVVSEWINSRRAADAV